MGTLNILMDPDKSIWWNNGNYGNIGNMVFSIFLKQRRPWNIDNNGNQCKEKKRERRKKKCVLTMASYAGACCFTGRT